MGRFAIAAKHHQTIAEIYEGEGADLDKAMQHYERAADFFKGEESNSSANKCMLKVRNWSSLCTVRKARSNSGLSNDY